MDDLSSPPPKHDTSAAAPGRAQQLTDSGGIEVGGADTANLQPDAPSDSSSEDGSQHTKPAATVAAITRQSLVDRFEADWVDAPPSQEFFNDTPEQREAKLNAIDERRGFKSATNPESKENLTEKLGGDGSNPQLQDERHTQAISSGDPPARARLATAPVRELPKEDIRETPTQKDYQKRDAARSLITEPQKDASTSEVPTGASTAVLTPGARRPVRILKPNPSSSDSRLNVQAPARVYKSPYGNPPAQVSAPVPRSYESQPPAQSPHQHVSASDRLSSSPRPGQGIFTDEVLRRVINEANSTEKRLHFTLASDKSAKKFPPAGKFRIGPPASDSISRPYPSVQASHTHHQDFRPVPNTQASNMPPVRRESKASGKGRLAGPMRYKRFKLAVQVEPDETFQPPQANPWAVHQDYEEEGVEEKIFRVRWSELRNERLREGRDALERSRMEEDDKQNKKRKRAEAYRKTKAARTEVPGSLRQPILIYHDDDAERGAGGLERIQHLPKTSSAEDVQMPPPENNPQHSLHPAGHTVPAPSPGLVWHASPHPYGHPEHPLTGLTDDHHTSSGQYRLESPIHDDDTYNSDSSSSSPSLVPDPRGLFSKD